MGFPKRQKNRRVVRQNILDVRVRTREARAARWRLAVAATALALGVLTVLFGLWRGGEFALNRFVYSNPAFGLRHLTVDSGVLPVEMVQLWSGLKAGDNLMQLDLERVKDDLELVPVVASASVQRVPPDAIRIQVVPRVPVAEILESHPRLEGGSGVVRYYLDSRGYLFQLPPLREGVLRPLLVVESLPRITGLPSHGVVANRSLTRANLKAALKFAETFRQSSMAQVLDVISIDLATPEVFVVHTTAANRVTFALENIEEQLARWRRVYDFASGQGRAIASLDLSVTRNVPLVLKEPSTSSSLQRPVSQTITLKKSHG